MSDLLDQLGVSSELSWSSIWPLMKGAMLGLLSTLLFTLWPLLKIRDIHPGVIFRRDAEQATVEHETLPSRWWVTWGLADRWNVGTAGGIILGLCALSVWQAGSWSIGFLFLGALSVAITILFVCARMFVRGLAWAPMPRVLSLRYALGNVVRPGSQATGIMVAIGIGVMVIVTVSLVEQALLSQIQENRPADAPTFFFIDIQPDQAKEFVSLVDRETGQARPELTPLVRSRLHAIDGHVVTAEEGLEKDGKGAEGKEARGKQWYFTREYVLTFLDQLPKDNQLVKGEWWKPGQVFSTPQVSVEEDAATHLGLTIGSIVEFDIQGATVSAKVSSIRKVEWGNFSTNFYMILSPGAIGEAPFTYVATVRVSPEKEVPLQQAVVASFPNVSAIHIGDVLDGFARVLDRLSLAIRAVALFCVAGRRVGHGGGTRCDTLPASLRIGDSEGARRDPRPDCTCLCYGVCPVGRRRRVDRTDPRECLVMGRVAVCVRSSLEHTPTGAWHRPPPHDVADADRGFCEHLPDSRPTAAGRASARVKDATRPVGDGNEEKCRHDRGNHAFRHGEDRQSDCVIGKAQVEDAAKASFFRSEETGKAKSDPLGTAGAHNGSVNHDGVIVLGRMKFEHHVHPIGMR